MTSWRDAKFRDDETWAEVRRAWEGGETGASVARRYDVGLANLWRRRAAEGWARDKSDDPAPVPVEGWDRYARRKLEEFEAQMEATRTLATLMVGIMQGGPMDEAPLWHLGFLYAWRAEHLGPEVAAADRAQAIEGDKPWATLFWDETGRLRRTRRLDHEILQLHRDTWRAQVSLPEGVATSYP